MPASSKPRKVIVKKHDWRDTCVGCSRTILANAPAIDIRIGKILAKAPGSALANKERFASKKNWGRMCLLCFSRVLSLPDIPE